MGTRKIVALRPARKEGRQTAPKPLTLADIANTWTEGHGAYAPPAGEAGGVSQMRAGNGIGAGPCEEGGYPCSNYWTSPERTRR